MGLDHHETPRRQIGQGLANRNAAQSQGFGNDVLIDARARSQLLLHDAALDLVDGKLDCRPVPGRTVHGVTVLDFGSNIKDLLRRHGLWNPIHPAQVPGFSLPPVRVSWETLNEGSSAFADPSKMPRVGGV
jgi:hypothetical protein